MSHNPHSLPGVRSDVWVARIFLLAILVGGAASFAFGFSPETLAVCPCPFHYFTGIECPGCGMTRACIALGRGDISNALHYNPFSLGLVLIAGIFALFPQRTQNVWRKFPAKIRNGGAWLLLALVLGVWIRHTLL
jgi:hypothetical protein